MAARERVNARGSKEFVYTDKDRKRIEAEDTKSTKEFKEALKERNKKKTKKSRAITLYRIQLLVLLVLMAIAIIYLYQRYQDEISLGKALIEIDLAVEETPVSFGEYLDNMGDYYSMDATLTGFLNRELVKLGTAGVYTESIVDSSGNKINLSNLNRGQKELFPRTGKTDELYNVTGRFKKEYSGLYFEVADIVKSSRS